MAVGGDGWPSADIFLALQAGDVRKLWGLPPERLRPFLPYLVRMALSPRSFSVSDSRIESRERDRRLVLSLIAAIPEANSIHSYLNMNYLELKTDAVKEKQLLRKLGSGEDRPGGQSVLATSMQFGLGIEFERSDHVRRLRLFLSELLRIMSKVNTQFILEQSDLFESDVHLSEICDILAITVEELPSLLNVVTVTESLLRLQNGPRLITCLIANMPDQLDHVLTHLLVNGETQDEVSLAGRSRTAALTSLLRLHPPSSPHAQTLSLLHHKHPTLALSIALSANNNSNNKHSDFDSGTSMRPDSRLNSSDMELGHQPVPTPTPTGVVTLLHNIIITGDDETRAWFLHYMKLMQQKYRRQRTSAVTKLRKHIMKTLLSYTKSHSDTKMTGTETLSVPMETEKLVKQKKGSEPQKEVEGHRGAVRAKRGVGEGDGGETTEGDSEIEMEAALDLVDQMEIEISDGEKETCGLSPKVGNVVVSSEGVEKNGRGMVGGKLEARSTKSSDEVVRAGRGERSRSRRRHSSGIPTVDFLAISQGRQLSDEETVELMDLLHVCCGLKLQCQMYLTMQETSVILSLIVCTCPSYSPAGIQFIRTTLAILLACPFLIGSSLECESATEQWLKWLLEKLPDFDRSCSEGSSYGEMLLLITIHLREKQLPQLEALIASTLGMKITGMRSGRFSHLRQIFLKVFTEEVVCHHAVNVSPTSRLSASLSGYLPVHCLHQLIKTKTFRKHNISITDWVYRQLLHLSEPLHPTVPPLVVEFVNAILLPANTSSHSRSYTPAGSVQGTHKTSHTPFSAEDVLRVYRHGDDDEDINYVTSSSSPPISQQAHVTTMMSSSSRHTIPTQLMMLYYVLVYLDTYNTNLRTLLLHSADKGSSFAPRPYSPNILAQIPVKRLLLYAGQNHHHYASLYPSLLRLTATHLPQLCLVEDWLKGEETEGRVRQFPLLLHCSSTKVTPSSAKAVLSQLQTSPSRAIILLSHLTSLPPSSLPPYCHALTSTLPLLLSSSTTRRVQDSYLALWTKLNLVTPRQLWLETVSELRPLNQHDLTPPTHAKLTEDPLAVLRCDPRVFRCPPVLEMLLRVLAAYTSASRAWLLNHCHTQNCIAMTTSTNTDGHMTVQERKALCVALTAAQESAIVQLLLEVCLPDAEEEELDGSSNKSGPGFHFSVLTEIRCIICSYLHQMFIAEPEMVKLVHFQGYPTQLLPITVAGIPSIHISLKFIPELVTQPQTQKQKFGILLASYVVKQYPLAEALKIVDDILKRLLTLTNEIPAHIREEYFSPLLPALVRFCQTFPPLCSQVTRILVELSRVSKSGSIQSSSHRYSLDQPPQGRGLGKRGGTAKEHFSIIIQNTFQELVETAVIKL